jgi:hypothetical protein
MTAQRRGRPIPSLVLVDVLGVRARWETHGADGAQEAFSALRSLVETALEDAQGSMVLEAVLESDAALILCGSTNAALRLAGSLFLHAFADRTPTQERRDRIWLRGVVLPRPVGLRLDHLRVRATIRADEVPIYVDQLAPELLAAIAAEKSGFKGMRLLVHPRLLTSRVREHATVSFSSGGEPISTILRLSGNSYTPRLKGFEDLLWMATNEEIVWKDLTNRMARRLRLAAHDLGELPQAASTQVLFDACESVLEPRFTRKRSSTGNRRRSTARARPEGSAER